MMLWLVRTFITGRFVQNEIQFFPGIPIVLPSMQRQVVRLDWQSRVRTDDSPDFNTVLENKASAEFAAAEALALQHLFQCHVHDDIVREFLGTNLKIGFVSLYSLQAIKNPTACGVLEPDPMARVTRIGCWKPACLWGPV